MKQNYIRYHAVAVLALLGQLLLAGCVSFSLGESGKPRTTVRKNVFLGGSANEIEVLDPVVSLDSFGNAKVRFELTGSVTEKEVTTTETQHQKGQRLAFGFFPGSSPDKTGGAAVETAFGAIWRNIIFVGLPTVSGLLVEPFVHAENEKCSSFSRSAIFGFHRWATPAWTDTKVERNTILKEKFDLDDFICDVKVDGVDYGKMKSANGAILVPVKKDSREMTLMLGLPKGHLLGSQLAPFVGIAMTVDLHQEQGK